ncbi:MAG: VOC family protein [Solirubrobacteraceae bacterium]|nr:VOC family protein [Patulibacter sp.]
MSATVQVSDAPAARITGFFHAGVTVKDMETSLRFYRDGLGLEIVEERDTSGTAWDVWNLQGDYTKVRFLAVPNTDVIIELFEFVGLERHSASARPCDYGAGHFCLYTDDTAAVYARMQALGFGGRSDVITLTSGPHAGRKIVYLIDPDGYHVEIYER